MKKYYVITPDNRWGPYDTPEDAHKAADIHGYPVQVHDTEALIECRECKGLGKVPQDYRGDNDCG